MLPLLLLLLGKLGIMLLQRDRHRLSSLMSPWTRAIGFDAVGSLNFDLEGWVLTVDASQLLLWLGRTFLHLDGYLVYVHLL